MKTPLAIAILDEVHSDLMEQLPGIQFDRIENPTEEWFVNHAKAYQGIVVRSSLHLSAKLLQSAPNLRFIARAGAGLDNIDEQAAAALNIELLNAGEGNRIAVAEHTLGLILSLLNNINKGNTEVHNKIWDREGNRGRELSSCTLGIIGFGNTGSALAKLLAGFNTKVLVYDKYNPPVNTDWVEAVTLEDLLVSSDIISLHIPLTLETKHMVNATFLDQWRGGFLINTARGEVVDLPALVNSLKSGKTVGTALDVLPNEKMGSWNAEETAMFQQLTHNNKIVLTPHVAGWSVESYRRISHVLANKIKRTLGLTEQPQAVSNFI